MKKKYTGINIQWPISQLIMSGKKTIETRTYPIPPKYVGQDLLLVETPGKSGKFKSRIVGIIRFDQSFQYKSKKEFIKDTSLHFVNDDSDWAWTSKKKWGWPITHVQLIKKPCPIAKRLGIRYTSELELPESAD